MATRTRSDEPSYNLIMYRDIQVDRVVKQSRYVGACRSRTGGKTGEGLNPLGKNHDVDVRGF